MKKRKDEVLARLHLLALILAPPLGWRQPLITSDE
jgi:hypothetical protein